jgi:hypothetical protein
VGVRGHDANQPRGIAHHCPERLMEGDERGFDAAD